MIVSFTGVVYTFLTLGLMIICYRFFLYWKKVKEIVSKFLLFALILLTIVCSFGAWGGIFFAEDPGLIRIAVILTSFFATLANSFFAYLTFYIRFPKISPWWGFGGVFLLGMITSFLTIIVPVKPYLEATGGINWGIPLRIGILRALLYFLGCFPLFLITFREWRRAEEQSLRVKSLLLGILLLFGTIIPIVDFVIEPVFNLHALISEVMILFLSAVALFLYLASVKIRPPKYVKKIT